MAAAGTQEARLASSRRCFHAGIAEAHHPSSVQFTAGVSSFAISPFARSQAITGVGSKNSLMMKIDNACRHAHRLRAE